jgi:hypothetical protein
VIPLCPECRQGKTVNCTVEFLDQDDVLRTCPTQERGEQS